MQVAYRSLLTALGGLLALWLVLEFWPLSTGSRVALSLLVFLVSGVRIWRQLRASQARATAVREIADENLPPEDFQGRLSSSVATTPRCLCPVPVSGKPGRAGICV